MQIGSTPDELGSYKRAALGGLPVFPDMSREFDMQLDPVMRQHVQMAFLAGMIDAVGRSQSATMSWSCRERRSTN